jgi:uncharacterized membrane protein
MSKRAHRTEGKAAGSEWAETPRSGRPAEAAAGGAVPNVPVLALSVVGMAIAGYLTYTGWSGGLAAFCGPGEGCDIVQSSRWATFLGLPTAFWGLVTYAALAVVAWREPRAAVQWHWASLVAMAGWSVSVYLTGVSVFVLDATCPYCLASLGIFTAILGVLWWQRGAAAPGVGRRALVQAAALSVVVIAAMHLQSAGDATAPFVAAGDPVAAGEDAYLSGLASRLAAFYSARKHLRALAGIREYRRSNRLRMVLVRMAFKEQRAVA